MQYRDEILKGTEKVLQTVTDLVLVSIFFGVEFGRRPTITVTDRGRAHLVDINYQTIKKTLENLVSRKLIEREGEGLILTKAGLEKLGEEILLDTAGMDRKRGEVYLIIYDISDEEIVGRNRLRRFL